MGQCKAAYLYTVLFGITTIAHAVQMFLHRKPYSFVITFSGALQTAAYVLRVLSIQNPASVGFYTYWFVIMMVAPIWTNAYAYMVMGRMVYNFTPSASVFKVKAWRFGLIFVLLDILAFLVQVAGAIMASGEKKSTDTIMAGLHIYMGGVGFQQLCIFFFLALAVRFHRRLQREPPSANRSRGLLLLYVEYAVVGLITVRIIVSYLKIFCVINADRTQQFRLIEYSNGLESTIPRKEAYQYVFDSTVMLIALVLYNVWHPGRLMPGQESNLPSRKVRKTWKRDGIQPHGRLTDDLLLPKYRSAAASGENLTGVDTSGQYIRMATPQPSP
ncbi:uncharacterized protein LTR77_009722 [Saxophila tyrrhenica]|uniref:Uncharacterized protein n=1 Tax=Saxophila tyrrhenica TaxID=1690608 RepID=A0AAV9NXC3_9PEZI|nr:hypothetical protein LTR77_009722 [Saxophila tyrrhenica]